MVKAKNQQCVINKNYDDRDAKAESFAAAFQRGRERNSGKRQRQRRERDGDAQAAFGLQAGRAVILVFLFRRS